MERTHDIGTLTATLSVPYGVPEEERRRAERDAYWAERHAWEAKHPILTSVERFCLSVRSEVQYFLEEHGVPLLAIVLFAFPLLMVFVTGNIARIVHRINMKRFRNHPAQSPQYYRDLPDDCPAPVVDRLIHFYDDKSSISRQLSATLLELNFSCQQQRQKKNTEGEKQNEKMTKRNIAVCIILSIVTLGIYGLYWFVHITNDVNKLAQNRAVVYLILELIIAPVGWILMQNTINSMIEG